MDEALGVAIVARENNRGNLSTYFEWKNSDENARFWK